jgi:ketosteroid isomerase-like protein
MTDSPNVELVRSIFADWERGDWRTASWAHPDIEYVMIDEPGTETHKGRAAMAEALRDYLSAWADYRVEAEEYRTLDEERVLVLGRAYGRGKTSGVEVSEAHGRGGAALFHIRDGMVVRLDAWFARDRALAELGLAPEGDTAAPD